MILILYISLLNLLQLFILEEIQKWKLIMKKIGIILLEKVNIFKNGPKIIQIFLIFLYINNYQNINWKN